MKTILVPTDFSENAANAIEYAAQIGLALQYRLLLLHVAEPETETDDEDEKLRVICEALQDSFPDLQCHYRMLIGEEIPIEIVSASQLYHAEMIVMGTKGVSNFEKILFGSNTASVIEKANCTVLSVPARNVFAKPKQILFATNFEHEDVAAALQIIKIAKPFGANLVIAHVLTEPGAEEVERAKIQLFTREVAVLADYPKITYRLSAENTVTMGLDILIENTKADVIAMRTHRRSLFEKIINPSITQKFAEESHIPLLAFHST
jgi:nucleotide-binding universal stress UspA family protein